MARAVKLRIYSVLKMRWCVWCLDSFEAPFTYIVKNASLYSIYCHIEFIIVYADKRFVAQSIKRKRRKYHMYHEIRNACECLLAWIAIVTFITSLRNMIINVAFSLNVKLISRYFLCVFQRIYPRMLNYTLNVNYRKYSFGVFFFSIINKQAIFIWHSSVNKQATFITKNIIASVHLELDDRFEAQPQETTIIFDCKRI